LKKISKRYTNSSSFKTETDALLRIYDNGGHPNISGLRDMYEDYNHFYLILDLVSGGEMFEHLINYGAYSEADAARLMYEIASAMAFLHGVGVVHADLKPENLLLDSKQRIDGVIKMIDFGCAVVSDEDGTGGVVINAPNANSNGTTAYWPPERFHKGIIADTAMDMWAVGIILYIMLTGVHPFDLSGSSTDDEIEKLIQTNPRPPMGEGFTDHLSPSAIDLIQRLMEPDPSKRISAYEMLNHSWVRGETASSVKIEDSDKRLSRFKELRNQLDAGIFAVLVNQGYKGVTLSEARPRRETKSQVISGGEASTNLMKKAFDTFDAEGKGFVTSDDLGRVVSQRIGHKLSQRDTRAFLKSRQGDASPDEKLSLSAFSGLFAGMQLKHFPRGHVIFHIGDTGDAMYFLSSGKVEVLTRKGQLVAILRSGDFFGEGSLLSAENKRFTTAKCATPVDVIEIKREDFDR
jgi:serine/threonine protein kinase